MALAGKKFSPSSDDLLSSGWKIYLPESDGLYITMAQGVGKQALYSAAWEVCDTADKTIVLPRENDLLEVLLVGGSYGVLVCYQPSFDAAVGYEICYRPQWNPRIDELTSGAWMTAEDYRNEKGLAPDAPLHPYPGPANNVSIPRKEGR